MTKQEQREKTQEVIRAMEAALREALRDMLFARDNRKFDARNAVNDVRKFNADIARLRKTLKDIR